MALTTEDFIKKSKEKWGESTYDYSKVLYTKARNEVELICLKKGHGSFFQKPMYHYNHQGCPLCDLEARRKAPSKTTEEFIKDSKNKFGDKAFDYTLTKYVHNQSKITLICPVHGEIQITPQLHLKSPTGCTLCSHALKRKPNLKNRKSQKEVIEDFKKIHGSKFDYSKVNYKGSEVKVEIICRKKGHGSFWQQPSNHYNGNGGCPKCKGEFYSKLNSSDTKDFIKKSIKIYGENRYSFDKVNYISSDLEVEVYCNICKKYFKKQPLSFLRNHGCPICSKREVSERKSLTFKEFEERAIKLHGTRFSYVKESFKTISEDISIICPIHGLFKVKGSSHIKKGSQGGCPKCKKESLRKSRIIPFNLLETKLKNDFDTSIIILNPKDYKDGRSLLKMKCLKCNSVFEKSTRLALQSKYTPCTNCNNPIESHRIPVEDTIKEFKKLYRDEYDYSLVKDKYVNRSTKVPVICNKCNNKFLVVPTEHLSKGCGCPICKSSKLERYTAHYLQDNNYSFFPQYSFPDCKNKIPLRFDFVIFNSDETIKCLLECQGVQHFQFLDNDFFGGEEGFKLRQKRDNIKKQYCKKNNIPLIEVKYDVKDIPKYLDKALKVLDKI